MFLTLLVALSSAAPLPPAAPDGEALIRKIQAAHAKSWFHTMTFVQKTSFPNRPVQWWYETMEAPGKLRLDVALPDGGVGSSSFFRNDSLYSLANGVKRNGRPYVHSMLVLIVEIHTQNPDTSIARLRRAGYDLSKSHDSTWQGRKVTVVGALSGDTTSTQFWVDNDNLVVVRMMERAANGTVTDSHIGKHAKAGNSLVEHEVLIHQNGKLIQTEEYTFVQTDRTLEAGTFDPDHFIIPAWIKEHQKANGIPGGGAE